MQSEECVDMLHTQITLLLVEPQRPLCLSVRNVSQNVAHLFPRSGYCTDGDLRRCGPRPLAGGQDLQQHAPGDLDGRGGRGDESRPAAWH
jgi:hypothetical protein